MITDEDITWVEGIMGSNIHFDSLRVDAIKNLESVDIQAFPGSGKTTLLVAKLAILARKWQNANSGICVLSHTNVAREEIENRLGNTDIGRKLLSYPHFIGTFHSFFDTFIAIPWLKSNGYEISRIDTDYVVSLRWKKLKFGTRNYFTYNHKDCNICQYKNKIGSIDWDKGGDTYSEVLGIIEQSQKHGLFTYNEMLLFAKEALEECKYISDSIQTRFPILFIDEAQDTGGFQWKLLNSAFNQDASIRQGFGDINQAIYGGLSDERGTEDFPREGSLVLGESKRFNDKIAKLANTVAITDSEMNGTSTRFADRDIDNSIILFERNSSDLSSVINSFGKLVLDTFCDAEIKQYEHEGIHVIGMIHEKKEETTEKQFPKGIYDYWGKYKPPKFDRSKTPQKFIDYLRCGIEEFSKTRENNRQIEWIAKGLGRVINKAKKSQYITVTGNVFVNVMSKLDYGKRIILRKYIKRLADIKQLNKEEWVKIVAIIYDILTIFDLKTNELVDDFIEWYNFDSLEIVQKNQITNNNCYVYVDKANLREVSMEFGSIHSVKGRTHLATLVLETYYKAHNMKSIIDYLCGTPPKKHKVLNEKRLKCQYVAMTRARGVLCLAIPKEFVDDKKQIKLKQIGWNIIYI